MTVGYNVRLCRRVSNAVSILAHLKTEEVVMDLIVGRSDPSMGKRLFIYFFLISFGKGKQQRRGTTKNGEIKKRKK